MPGAPLVVTTTDVHRPSPVSPGAGPPQMRTTVQQHLTIHTGPIRSAVIRILQMGTLRLREERKPARATERGGGLRGNRAVTSASLHKGPLPWQVGPRRSIRPATCVRSFTETRSRSFTSTRPAARSRSRRQSRAAATETVWLETRLPGRSQSVDSPRWIRRRHPRPCGLFSRV